MLSSMHVHALSFCSHFGSSFIDLGSIPMCDRAAKLRKLNDFRRRLPHCTASALSAILSDVRKHGLPECGLDRNRLREARDLQNSEPTPFGPILQTAAVIGKDDVEQQLTIAHPLAMLWVASSDSSSFSEFMQQKLKDHPPWRSHGILCFTLMRLHQATPWPHSTKGSSMQFIGAFLNLVSMH